MVIHNMPWCGKLPLATASWHLSTLQFTVTVS